MSKVVETEDLCLDCVKRDVLVKGEQCKFVKRYRASQENVCPEFQCSSRGTIRAIVANLWPKNQRKGVTVDDS